MRRGRNQAHPGYGMAHLRDDVIHLVARQLAAFAGLRALCHLDLQLIGIYQIIRGDAEAPAGHLLDGTAAQITVRIGLKAGFIFAAFAGIGTPANAVHRDGQRLMRFLRDGPETHGPGGKTFDDLAGRFHIFQRDRRALFELEQAAQSAEFTAAGVNGFGVILKRFEAVLPHGLLQLADSVRVQQMIFTTYTERVTAADRKLRIGVRQRYERIGVFHHCFPCQHIQPHAFNSRRRSGKVLFYELAVQADGFKDLRSAIALQRGNAHLRENFEQALVDGFDVVVQSLIEGNAFRKIAANRQIFHGLNREIGVDGTGAVANEQRVMHHFPRLAGFNNQRDLGAAAFSDQVVVNSREREQAGDGGVVLVHAAVRNNQNGIARLDGQ